MRLSRNDLVFTAAALIVIGLLGRALHLNYESRIAYQAKGKPVGTVVYKRYIVKRKYADRFVWEKIESESPVFPYDGIMVGARSDALISLTGQGSISLDAYTMVEIDMQGDTPSILLKQGSVTASGDPHAQLYVSTTNGAVFDASRGVLRLAQGADGVAGAVLEGEVSVRQGTGDTTRFAAGSRLTLDREGRGIEYRQASVALSEPADGMVLPASGRLAPVTMAWNDPSGCEEYHVTVSQDPRIEKGRVLPVRGKSLTVELPEGRWFWQVDGKKDGETLVSLPGSFLVVPQHGIRIFTPEEGAVLLQDTPGLPVAFRWKTAGETRHVRFVLAGDAALTRILRDETTVNPGLTIAGLPPGRYFWQLTPFFPEGSTAPATTPRSFRIESRAPRTAAIPQGQVDTTATNRDTAESSRDRGQEEKRIAERLQRSLPGGLSPQGRSFSGTGPAAVTLSWQAVPEANGYLVDVYAGGGNRPLFSRRTATTHTTFTPPATPGRSEYEWRVRAVYAASEGRVQAESRTGRGIFTVIILPAPPEVRQVTVEESP